MTREEDIKKAVETMRKGGVILYPTDTVWGIGCDATNTEAVKRVYEIKQRDDSKALICLVDSDARMQRYFRNVPDVAWQLVDSLKEGDGIFAESLLTYLCDVAANGDFGQSRVVLREVIGDVRHTTTQFNLLGGVDDVIVPIFYVDVTSLIIAVQFSSNKKLVVAVGVCVVVVLEVKRLVAILHLESLQ